LSLTLPPHQASTPPIDDMDPRYCKNIPTPSILSRLLPRLARRCQACASQISSPCSGGPERAAAMAITVSPSFTILAIADTSDQLGASCAPQVRQKWLENAIEGNTHRWDRPIGEMCRRAASQTLVAPYGGRRFSSRRQSACFLHFRPPGPIATITCFWRSPIKSSTITPRNKPFEEHRFRRLAPALFAPRFCSRAQWSPTWQCPPPHFFCAAQRSWARQQRKAVRDRPLGVLFFRGYSNLAGEVGTYFKDGGAVFRYILPEIGLASPQRHPRQRARISLRRNAKSGHGRGAISGGKNRAASTSRPGV